MSIQDLGSIGEVIGAVAIFVTLIYLARQIKDNSQMLSTSIYESAMAGYNELNALIVTDPAQGAVLRHLFMDPIEPFTDLEQFQVTSMVRMYCNHIYKLFRLYEAGALPEKEWLNTANEASQILNDTSLNRSFMENNHYFDDLWLELRKYQTGEMSNFLGE